jgi:hypothetical protein
MRRDRRTTSQAKLYRWRRGFPFRSLSDDVKPDEIMISISSPELAKLSYGMPGRSGNVATPVRAKKAEDTLIGQRYRRTAVQVMTARDPRGAQPEDIVA